MLTRSFMFSVEDVCAEENMFLYNASNSPYLTSVPDIDDIYNVLTEKGKDVCVYNI